MAIFLHIECRSPIMSKCIELFPDALDDMAMISIATNANQRNFPRYADVLTL
jgi:hypothetical protein